MRLIDADALTRQVVKKLHITNSFKDITDLIDEAPTIDVNKVQTSAEPNIANGEVSVSDMAGDLVSREEALQCKPEFLNPNPNDKPNNYPIGWNDAIKSWYADIKALPSAIPQNNDWSKYSDRLWKLAYERGKADRPKVNSAEWVAEKEKEFEELNTPKFKLELITKISAIGGY